MSKTSIFEKRWLDVVFEGKNKSYGAYQLRLENRKTTLLAMLYGILCVGGLGTGGFMLSSFGNHPDADPIALPDDVVVVTPYITDPKVLPPLPPKPKTTQPLTETESETDWRKDPEVAKPTDVNTTPDNDTKPSAPAQPDPGTSGAGSDAGSEAGKPGGSDLGTTTTDEGPAILSTLEKRPEYPGGIEQLYRKVAREFEKPEMYENANIRIIVSFVVEKDGRMTDIKILNKPGESLEREALRVMKTFTKKWEPGIKNGKAVRTLFTLPIVIKPE